MPPNPVCCIVPGFLKPKEGANWQVNWNLCFDIFCRTHEEIKLVANLPFIIKRYLSCCFQ